MAILKKLLIPLLPLVLAGCYEDFTPDIDTAPVLCLNSIITAGEPIEVQVSRTWLFTDEAGERNPSVPDAAVTIYANGSPVGDDYIPQEGDSIRIVADSKTYGHAEAEVVVPVSVPIAKLDWDAAVTSTWEFDYEDQLSRVYRLDVKVRMKIDDPASAVNYYQFAYEGFPEEPEYDPGISIWRPYEFWEGTFKYEVEPIFKEHIGLFESITSADDAFGFTCFTDKQFSGQSYTLNLQFNNARYAINGAVFEDEMADCGYEFKLYSISPSYYNWSVYRWNVDEGFISDFGDMGLGDPVWGYSNVSTGAGIVMACSSSTYTLNLSDFLKSVIFNRQK
ncbi:MAG: DUF4249 domain-containing protein [Muribaculaceae bacterium]|nr:DUF4249 domain-containing protein [Muribaculaceae bacterium]